MNTPEPRRGPTVRPLRADARRNREAILAAARDAFARLGLEAPLDAVARQAGVAIGTLYSHFPTRLNLIEAVFAEKLQEWVRIGEQALAMDDPWDGFTFYLESVCELQAQDRGFNDLASMSFPEARSTQRAQDRVYELAHRIVGRARRQGVLRPDFTPEDIAFVIWGQARTIQATRAAAPNAWRRQLAFTIDGFRAESAHPPPEPPLHPSQVRRAMLHLGGCDDAPGR